MYLSSNENHFHWIAYSSSPRVGFYLRCTTYRLLIVLCIVSRVIFSTIGPFLQPMVFPCGADKQSARTWNIEVEPGVPPKRPPCRVLYFRPAEGVGGGACVCMCGLGVYSSLIRLEAVSWCFRLVYLRTLYLLSLSTVSYPAGKAEREEGGGNDGDATAIRQRFKSASYLAFPLSPVRPRS